MTRALAGLSAALVLAATAVAITHRSVPLLGEAAIAAAMAGVPVAAGLLVSRRRPGHRLAPLLALVGFVAALLLGGEVLDAAPEPPGAVYVDVAGQGAWILFYLAIVVLVLCFPDGRLQSTASRWLLVAMLVDVGAFLVLAATAPGPFDAPYQDAPHVFGTMPAPWDQVLVITLPGLLVVLAATALVSRSRYRHAGPAERVQWRWLALGTGLLPITLLSCWASYLLLGTADVVIVGLALMYVGIPAVVAVALLCPDILDVDRALSATVMHGSLTAVLLGLFTVVDVVVGLVLGAGSVGAAVIATALCAALLAPARRRLQSVVDRRLYPARATATAAVEALRRRTSALQEAPENLTDVLRDALDDRSLTVAFAGPGQAPAEMLDAAGEAVSRAPDAVPVLLDGVVIGELSAGSTSRELLREVAVTAAPIVEVVRLRLQLRRALAEVEGSRARLLRIGYHERRRLERDLHDGAQQRLVSLGMTLRLAQRRLARPEDADQVDVGDVLGRRGRPARHRSERASPARARHPPELSGRRAGLRAVRDGQLGTPHGRPGGRGQPAPR